MPIKRIIFIRPGETEWNRVGRQQGWVAIPLNEHGRMQSQRLASFVRNIGVGMLYASDLPRAAETAAIIGEQLGIEPILDPRLRERNVGQWQGLTLAEIREWYPEDYRRFRENLLGYQVPGGESRKQVLDRFRAAFSEIIARGSAETVGVVSHSIGIRLVLADLVQGIDTDAIELSNISVTTIRRGGEEQDVWQLVEANDISHLDGLETQIVEEPEA